MSINPDIRDQAYQFFIEEAPDLLQEIESGILTLRQERDTAKVHSIMRAAHSIKGGSASVGLDAIKTIAHRLETIFKALYSESIEIDSDLESQLLQAYDCLRLPLMEQLTYAQFDAEQALEAADAVLVDLETRFASAIEETSDFIPSSEDLGVSMAQSIFEIDVAEGLERLENVLNHPEKYEVAGELRAQAEVFTGFAELLNLPGFAAIAAATLNALERHPQRSVEITQLALADFRAGQADVLTNKSSQGGTPSAALLALADSAQTTAPEPAATAPNLNDWLSDDVETLLEQLGDGVDRSQLLAELGLLEDPAIAPLPVADVIGMDDAAIAAVDESDVASELEVDAPAAALQQVFGDMDAIAPSRVSDQSNLLPLDELSELDHPFDFSDDADLYEVEPLFLPPTGLQEAAVPEQVASDPATLDRAGDPAPDLADSRDSVQDRAPSPVPVSSAMPPAAQTGPVPILAPRESSAAPAKPENAVVGLTVRVEADRLARMDNLLGELTINRNGVELQNTQLRGAVRELLNRFGRFQSAVEKLRGLSDQMLVAPERQGATGGTSQNGNGALTDDISRQTEFDSLEMDNYNQLYSQTQILLEDLVQLEEAVEDVSLFSYQSDQLLGRHRKMLSQMQDELMWARMLPLEGILNRFPRVLRDLSNTYKKPVNLKLSGTDILVDKAVLARIYDPMVHLLRNSFDHGIESPDVRRQQGKPEEGQIEVRARYKGRQVIIEVYDDGRGLDLKRIRDRVVEVGWMTAVEAANASEARLQSFIFEPGFSTAQQVSELSGRGVGLDIVQEQIRALKGSIAVTSSPGRGTTFTLTLPLTMSIVNLLICFVGSTPIAIRSDSIQEILIPTPAQIRQEGTQQFLNWQGEEIPAYNLADLLNYQCLIPEMPPSRVLATVPTPTNWESPMLVLTRRNQAFALQIDRLVTEQELVVKPFGAAITPPIFAYGCTVLGDGSLIPVIDGPVFLDDLVSRSLTATPEATEADALNSLIERTAGGDRDQAGIQMLQATTVLVVDDSVTLRRTLALSLERAGYRVLQARDGQEALEQLEQSQASVQMVICDVEMPNMNGFEFLTKRRETPEYVKIPTVMLTSRGNDKHRWLAMKLGAKDYFTKPYLEQELLSAIADYIAEAKMNELSESASIF